MDGPDFGRYITGSPEGGGARESTPSKKSRQIVQFLAIFCVREGKNAKDLKAVEGGSSGRRRDGGGEGLAIKGEGPVRRRSAAATGRGPPPGAVRRAGRSAQDRMRRGHAGGRDHRPDRRECGAAPGRRRCSAVQDSRGGPDHPRGRDGHGAAPAAGGASGAQRPKSARGTRRWR